MDTSPFSEDELLLMNKIDNAHRELKHYTELVPNYSKEIERVRETLNYKLSMLNDYKKEIEKHTSLLVLYREELRGLLLQSTIVPLLNIVDGGCKIDNDKMNELVSREA